MKYLNVGCGYHFSKDSVWTNLDYVACGEGVIQHNLLEGIPFLDNSFDAVYHSHVLEHFAKEDAGKFIAECFRVLKPGGTLRIAIPDLERIARQYLRLLEEGMKHPDDSVIRANYEWMLQEMYDQTVRNSTGGNMEKYLLQETMVNEPFVLEQIGQEAMRIRQMLLQSKGQQPPAPKPRNVGMREKISTKVSAFLLDRWKIDLRAHDIGKFRLGGEIHQWMYDRYSLSQLLKSKGGKQIEIRDAFTSYIPDWNKYELDSKNTVVRKPDSLFIEAQKSR
jgi:predicted SAM-dependent methyltransferase